MDYLGLGRLLRVLRIRRGWRQLDVALRAGLSPAAVGRHENGRVQSIRALERHAAAFGLRVRIRLTGRGGELDRLGDEEHAAIVELVAHWLRLLDFVTEAEVSFNEWGERGRIDLLGWHPASRTLVIVEAKTELSDLQHAFGALDVKVRLAERVVASRGWLVRGRATLLVVADSDFNRRVVANHPALFAAFRVRRLAKEILGDGQRSLCWIAPHRASRKRWNSARRRVRMPVGR